MDGGPERSCYIPLIRPSVYFPATGEMYGKLDTWKAHLGPRDRSKKAWEGFRVL